MHASAHYLQNGLENNQSKLLAIPREIVLNELAPTHEPSIRARQSRSHLYPPTKDSSFAPKHTYFRSQAAGLGPSGSSLKSTAPSYSSFFANRLHRRADKVDVVASLKNASSSDEKSRRRRKRRKILLILERKGGHHESKRAC